MPGQRSARYKSKIAYDGTAYSGFQRQAEGIATVQATFEAALRQLGWHGDSVLAAGRTDAGVHARGQIVAFDLAWDHEVAELTAALNANLPPNVAVWQTARVSGDFHPRYDARRRRYSYSVITTPQRDPLRERYAWRRWPPPMLSAMQRVSQELVGAHDFGAFGRPPVEGGSTVRTISRAGWSERADTLRFDVAGDAFLQHMVRKIVAANIAAGVGQVAPEEVIEFIDRPKARWEGRIAPARGLCLEAVEYEGEVEDETEDTGEEMSPRGGNRTE